MKARAVVGKGQKSLRGDRWSELRLGREKDIFAKMKHKHCGDYINIAKITDRMSKNNKKHHIILHQPVAFAGLYDYYL